MTAHAYTKAPHSWTHETIGEHVGTLATLEMLKEKDWEEQKPTWTRLVNEAHLCATDLVEKLHAHGLRSVTTATHTAEIVVRMVGLTTIATVDVRRRTND